MGDEMGFSRNLRPRISTGYYILENDVIHEIDLRTWAEYMEQDPDQNGRRTAQTIWDKFDKPTRLSTIFLGLDHNFSPGGLLVLWETCFFYNEEAPFPDCYSRVLNRYTSLTDAKAGHEKLVQVINLIEDLSSIIRPELGDGT